MTSIQHQPQYVAGRAVFSAPSILAFIAALASFAVSPGYQLLLCIAALVLGAIGVIASLLPSVRGGIMSLFSLVVGGLGAIVAIVRLLASL